MPKKVSAKKRASKINQSISRLTSSDEKRELILAHLEARAPAVQSKLIYVGVGAAVIALIVGGVWLHAVGQNISATLSGPRDPNLQLVIDQTQKAKEQIIKEQGGQLQGLKEQTLQGLEQLEAVAQKQAALNELAAEMVSSVKSDQVSSGPN